MPTVDATVGGASANSYGAVADADAYFEASFGRPLWASSTDKDALLITASRVLDQYLLWSGTKTTDEQAMEWPRQGAYNKVGIEYDDDIVPMPVKFATYELAYHMLANGVVDFTEQNIDRVKVGSIDVEFAKGYVDTGIPSHIENMISHIATPLVAKSGAARSVRLVRT